MRPFIVLISGLLLLLCSGCRQRAAPIDIGTLQPESELFWNAVPRQTVVEKIGIDFQFTEGPAWHPEGFLVFSDIPANAIYRWTGRKFGVYVEPSNHSNGLLALPDGSLLACEHGSRSLASYTSGGERILLADRYGERRFNSPNDLCRASDGSIYFTDPPYGLPAGNDDPGKELHFSGVFRYRDGKVTLVDSTLSWPNGIGLSPGERYLYVANHEIEPVGGEETRRVFWVRYTLDETGEVSERMVFFTAPDPSLPGGADGMAVDRSGNLFLTGPGGILVVDPGGNYLGTIGMPFQPSNLVFGPGEKVIYVTARSNILRILLG